MAEQGMSAGSQSDLVLSERMGPFARLHLNNPPFNAASLKLLEALHVALDDIEADPQIRCVILAGAGKRAFCAGADIREEKRFRDPAVSREFRALGRRTLIRLEAFSRPIIAAIHGYCIGGGTALAWACDLRVAAEDAVFRAGDAYLGVIPSWGMGLTRLPRFVGRANALDILLLGENFSAARAYELGLVTRVVPSGELEATALAMAERIAKASPIAIQATRRAVNYNLRHGWDEMVRFEEQLSEEVFNHPDCAEGMSAFLEKRAPVFQDPVRSEELP
jgi:enoyl-CoA hydratase/carnithine racemase